MDHREMIKEFETRVIAQEMGSSLPVISCSNRGQIMDDFMKRIFYTDTCWWKLWQSPPKYTAKQVCCKIVETKIIDKDKEPDFFIAIVDWLITGGHTTISNYYLEEKIINKIPYYCFRNSFDDGIDGL